MNNFDHLEKEPLRTLKIPPGSFSFPEVGDHTEIKKNVRVFSEEIDNYKSLNAVFVAIIIGWIEVNVMWNYIKEKKCIEFVTQGPVNSNCA